MSQSDTFKNQDKENIFAPAQSFVKGNLVFDDSLIAQLPRRSSITSEDDDSMDERLFYKKITFQKEREIKCESTILLFPCL